MGEGAKQKEQIWLLQVSIYVATVFIRTLRQVKVPFQSSSEPTVEWKGIGDCAKASASDHGS